MSDSFEYEGTYKRRSFSGMTLAETLRRVAAWLESPSNGKYGHNNEFYVIDISYEYDSEFSDSHRIVVTHGVINE